MPRKGPAPRRPLVVDPVYNSPLVTQLVNKILLHGKRSVAESIVYGALEGTREKSGGTDPVITLDRKSTRLNPSHPSISYAVFCLKKKNGQVGVHDQRQHLSELDSAVGVLAPARPGEL